MFAIKLAPKKTAFLYLLKGEILQNLKLDDLSLFNLDYYSTIKYWAFNGLLFYLLHDMFYSVLYI